MEIICVISIEESTKTLGIGQPIGVGEEGNTSMTKASKHLISILI